jgi:hypothetical protein
MRATKAGTNGGPYGDVSVCRRISDLGFSRFHWPGRHYWPEAPSLNGCMTQHFVVDRVSSKTSMERRWLSKWKSPFILVLEASSCSRGLMNAKDDSCVAMQFR